MQQGGAKCKGEARKKIGRRLPADPGMGKASDQL
jgi:hypothetical protein